MAINKEFNELFFKQQYQYFEDNGYKLYKTNTQQKYSRDLYYYINGSKYQQKNLLHKDTHIYSIYGIKAYIEEKTYSEIYHFFCNDKENTIDMNMQFICKFYKENPTYQKFILKEFHQFTTYNNISEYYKKLIDTLIPQADKKEVMKFIINFPLSTWSTFSVNFHDLEEYLYDKGVAQKEFDDFFLKFLKSRKKQLIDLNTGNKLKAYLTKRFGSTKEDLEPYIDLIPLLKAEFEEPEIDFFFNESKFTDVIYIDGKKIKDSYMISTWKEEKYQGILFLFCQSIKTYYKLNSCSTEVINKQKHSYELIFRHDNENVTKPLLKELIIDFFVNLRLNPVFEVTKENCLSWLLNRKLEDLIEEKSQIKENSDNKQEFTSIKKKKI